MRRLTMLLGATAVGLALGGAPSASALTGQQTQTLQQASVTGGTALRAAALEVVAAELAAGRPVAAVAEELLDALMGLSAEPQLQADFALVGVLALAEAADGRSPGGTAAAEAAAAGMAAALRRGATSESFLRAFVDAAAAASASSPSPYAALLGSAMQTALETTVLPSGTREAVQQLAQGSGLLVGTGTAGEPGSESGSGGGSGSSGGGAFAGGFWGGLPGIPGAVSSDRPGDSNASPS